MSDESGVEGPRRFTLGWIEKALGIAIAGLRSASAHRTSARSQSCCRKW